MVLVGEVNEMGFTVDVGDVNCTGVEEGGTVSGVRVGTSDTLHAIITTPIPMLIHNYGFDTFTPPKVSWNYAQVILTQ